MAFPRNVCLVGEVPLNCKVAALQRCNAIAYSKESLISFDDAGMDAMVWVATGWQPGTDLSEREPELWLNAFGRMHAARGFPLCTTGPGECVEMARQQFGVGAAQAAQPPQPYGSQPYRLVPDTESGVAGVTWLTNGQTFARLPAGSWALLENSRGEAVVQSDTTGHSHLAALFFPEVATTRAGRPARALACPALLNARADAGFEEGTVSKARALPLSALSNCSRHSC